MFHFSTFLFSSSPLCHPPPLSLSLSSLVFFAFPTLVVPVHSIRLEYGCVVVDTCSVVGVVVLWFVAPRGDIQHGAVIGTVEMRDERGDPGSLKKHKNTGSHFTPYSFLKTNISGTFPLCTVSLWDLSLDMETNGLDCMYFLLMISCHALTNVEKGLGCWLKA